MPESAGENPQPVDFAKPSNSSGPTKVSLIIMVFLCIAASIFVARLLLPSIGSDGTGTRVHSASNLRQIGQAIILYCNDNKGIYPDSFQTLLAAEEVASEVFLSPIRNETPAQGPTTQAVVDQLKDPTHVSYVYLGKNLNQQTVTPDTIVAYEILESPNIGTNVLFGDGHVEYFDAPTAAKIDGRANSGVFPVTMPSSP